MWINNLHYGPLPCLMVPSHTEATSLRFTPRERRHVSLRNIKSSDIELSGAMSIPMQIYLSLSKIDSHTWAYDFVREAK